MSGDISEKQSWENYTGGGDRNQFKLSETFPAIIPQSGKREYNGVFEMEALEMIEGDLPGRDQRLVREWAEKYRNYLHKMWEKQELDQLPALAMGVRRYARK